jgi:hypothetical protein
MIDLLEIPKGVVPFSEKFLGQTLSIDQMPNFFSFQSSEIRYGLQALSKWARAAGGKETAGVIYESANENMRFRHITIGSESDVNIFIHDLSKLTPVNARNELQTIAHYDTFSQKAEDKFVLLPEDCQNNLILSKRIIIEKGKKLDGSIHVHPSGNPPNGHDLALLLFNRDEPMKGVIAGDKHYVMVASKTTPNYDIQPTNKNMSTTMHDFGDEIDNETDKLIAAEIPVPIAIMQSLVKHCRLNSVGLYEGSLETNIYRKIV